MDPETMFPFHVRRKVCIAHIHVRSKFEDHAPHMDGSNADFSLQIEGSHAGFAPHIEQTHSFRVQKKLKFHFLPNFKKDLFKPTIFKEFI